LTDKLLPLDNQVALNMGRSSWMKEDLDMKKNVGATDKWIRIVAGLVLLALVFVIKSDWRWLGLIGVILLGTAFMNFCPIYKLFGISTNKSGKKE
jgi:hypothetical protein